MINRSRMPAIIGAGLIGALPVGRISDNISIIAESDVDPAARLKLEAERREADRIREQERRQVRARTNFLPHGSTREALRRRRQIERGQLKAENGLAR